MGAAHIQNFAYINKLYDHVQTYADFLNRFQVIGQFCCARPIFEPSVLSLCTIMICGFFGAFRRVGL
jgi:hypothetical protein